MYKPPLRGSGAEGEVRRAKHINRWVALLRTEEVATVSGRTLLPRLQRKRPLLPAAVPPNRAEHPLICCRGA